MLLVVVRACTSMNGWKLCGGRFGGDVAEGAERSLVSAATDLSLPLQTGNVPLAQRSLLYHPFREDASE